MRRLLLLALIAGLLVGGPTPPARAAAVRPAPAADEETISFARLGMTEKSLRGPFDAAYLDFSLPASWELTDQARLQINFNTFFARGASTLPGGQATTSAITFGGTLRVVLNDVTIDTVLLDQPGERSLTLPIPSAALRPVRGDGRHTLNLLLDTNEQCGIEQYTSLVIRPSSALVLPHRIVAPPTDLTRLPLPIAQRSFEPDAATIVVPDAPTAGEIQAALTIAAGFGRMTGGKLDLRLATIGRLDERTRRESHLIVVGRPAAFPMLRSARLPAPAQDAGFAAPGAAPGDGVIQMAVSPWNDTKVLLVVGGSDDSAVIKAAQAISSGSVQAGARADIALVAAVQPKAAADAPNIDRTFADLGYDSQRMYGLGGQYAGYQFDLPAGQTIGAEAYLDLVFVHTGLLDYDQSSLTISLNDEPVASVRLDDNSTRISSARLPLPTALLRPGSNQLTIRADLLPRAICADPRGSGLWMVIRPESTLHLPLSPAQPGVTTQATDLSRYPLPFTVAPNLDGLAFVVQHGDPAGWDVAARIAFDLGQQMWGRIADLGAAYGDAVPDQLRSSHDLLIVGRPGALALIGELNDRLPEPFPAGGNLATERGATVVYRSAPDTSIGYVELLRSPWSTERSVLAVLGSTDEGLAWAGAALTVPRLRSALHGDVAVIRGERIDSRDTRPKSTTAVSTTATLEPGRADIAAQPPSRLLLLAGALLLLLAIAGSVALIVWWRRRRQRAHAASAPTD